MKPVRLRRSQSGFATLVVTLILLFGITIVLLYSTRGAIGEQRLSSNEVRSKQAFNAASAGLRHALEYMSGTGGVDKNADGWPEVVTPPAGTPFAAANSATYRVGFCDASIAVANLPQCPATPAAFPAFNSAALCNTAGAGTPPPNFSSVRAYSCGWSDDNTSVQRIVAGFAADAPTTVPAAAPLISRGVANLLTGGASILNYFNDLTVWSGGSLLGQSNTGKTFVRDTVNYPLANRNADANNNQTPDFRETGNSPACNNPPTGYTCATQGSQLGHDAVFGDTRLSSLNTNDAFFTNFFGMGFEAYRDNRANWIVDPSATLANRNSTNVNSLNGMQGAVVWVEGDLTLPDMGYAGNPYANPPVPPQPVTLIVNGNLTFSANSVFNGLIYVKGTVSGNGSPKIYGGLITFGGATANGNPLIIYDPAMLAGTSPGTKAAQVPGSWRDW